MLSSRISDYRFLSIGENGEQLKEKYLQYDDEDEKGWRIKMTPCPFHYDNKCTVYDARPQNCGGYPYLHESGFSSRTMGMLERTFTCPIVFNVMEQLKKELAFDTEDFKEDCW